MDLNSKGILCGSNGVGEAFDKPFDTAKEAATYVFEALDDSFQNGLLYFKVGDQRLWLRGLAELHKTGEVIFEDPSK